MLNSTEIFFRYLFTKLIFMQGNILYRFPSLQRTAAPGRRGKKEYVGRRWTDLAGGKKFFEEKKWSFRYLIVALGSIGNSCISVF